MGVCGMRSKKVLSISVDVDVYNMIERLRKEKKVNVSAYLNDKLKEILEQEFNL
jgi:hypothetical protein